MTDPSSENGSEKGRAAAQGDLGERIRAAKQALEPGAERSLVRNYNSATLAWRMTLELVVGTAIGFLIGFSLDSFFGTQPIFLIVFGLFGFAAGVKTLLTTAKEGGESTADKQAAASSAKARRPDGGAGGSRR